MEFFVSRLIVLDIWQFMKPNFIFFKANYLITNGHAMNEYEIGFD